MKAPPNQQAMQELVGSRWAVSSLWQRFFSDVFDAILAMQSSGTTVQRPTKGLYVGRVYFDTDLGLPIWYKGPGWVKADGTAA